MNKKTYFKPEVLAPAGDIEKAYAAADAGADAVYFGLDDFSARQSAVNVHPNQLKQLVMDLHRQGVRSYVTLNTILYQAELEKARLYFEICLEAKVDAIIVQDLYWLILFSKLQPEMELHASTQMNIHSAPDIEAAAKLGYKRIVLPRETSAEQLALWTEQARKLNLETELFVHGAVCMAVSGRCQMSFAQGGRSANRGSCAQACRLAYKLQSSAKNLLDQGALLSAKDQSLISYIPLFSELEVNSLKIEGRMKDASYVRAATSAYRKAIDFWAETGDEKGFAEYAKEQELLLLQVFNRGGSFTQRSFVQGDAKNHITGEFVGNHGVYLGDIVKLEPKQGSLSFYQNKDKQALLKNGSLHKLLPELNPKDLLAVRRSNVQLAVAPVGIVNNKNSEITVKGFHPRKLKQMQVGDQIFLLSNAELIAKNELEAKEKLDLNLEFRVSQDHLTVKAISSVRGRSINAEKTYFIDDYELLTQSLPEKRWIQQLSKTGQTNFTIKHIEFEYEAGTELPALRISSINRLRREIIDLLEKNIVSSFESDKKPFAANPSILRLLKRQTEKVGKLRLGVELYTSSEEQESFKSKILLSIIKPESFTDLSKLNLTQTDQVEISLLFLSNISETNRLFEQIFRINPQLEILIRLPEILQIKQMKLYDKLKKNYRTNSRIGFSANGLSILTPELYERKLKHVNEQSNIINTEALDILLRSDIYGISISPEWNDQSLDIFLSELSDQECARIYLPFNYLVPEMFLNYCPVGKNAFNCKKCITEQNALWSQTYSLITQQHPFTEHSLVTYPYSCISQIFAGKFNNDLWHNLSDKNKKRVSKRVTQII